MPRVMTETDRETLSRVLLFCFERNKRVYPTGSRVIGGSTPDSDWDYVIEAQYVSDLLGRYLLDLGFVVAEGADGYEARCSVSYRCGAINLIVCNGRSYFENWIKATEVAKVIQPDSKEQRVLIFDAVFGEMNVLDVLRNELETETQREELL